MSRIIKIYSCSRCPIRKCCRVYLKARLFKGFGWKSLDKYKILPDCPHPKKQSNTERKELYTIEEVLAKVTLGLQPKRGTYLVDFDGDMIDMGSRRYHTFKAKGVTCCQCGIKGVFFAKERTANDNGVMPNKWHLELYAIDKNGREIMMTKDHIIPKAKNGRDYIDNLRTMCYICNGKKSDAIEEKCIGDNLKLRYILERGWKQNENKRWICTGHKDIAEGEANSVDEAWNREMTWQEERKAK